MCLKWVLCWEPDAGSTVNNQILHEVSQCLASFDGINQGNWKVIITWYRAVARVSIDSSMRKGFPKDLMGILLPEQPGKYYIVLGSKRIVLEADSTTQAIIRKLQSYESRVTVDVQGIQYQVGDFQLRLGKVINVTSNNLRAIVMEVEYLPVSSVGNSRQILDHFLKIWKEAASKRSLPGHFIHLEIDFAEFGLSDRYTSRHTSVQYSMLIYHLVKTHFGERATS